MESMDLSRVLTVEYADAIGGGCTWHGDNECLCDVNPALFPVRDGTNGYNVPPDMVERFMDLADSESDEWFFGAWDTIVGDTALRSAEAANSQVYLSEVWGLAENHPEMVEAMIDTSVELTRRQYAERYQANRPSVEGMCRFLMVPRTGKAQAADRNKILAAEVVRRYEAGEDLGSIREWAKSLPTFTLPDGQIQTWLRRGSPRYQAEAYRPREVKT